MAGLTLVVMMIVAYKVYKIVRFINKLILSVALLLNLYVASILVLHINNTYNRYFNFDKNKEIIPKNELTLVVFSMNLFLNSALYLNLRLWLNHYLLID